jgi:hypothetical protein
MMLGIKDELLFDWRERGLTGELTMRPWRVLVTVMVGEPVRCGK